MFNYFGSKHYIAHLYPAPIHPLIIEPFAGSAGYSLHYAEKNVWLNDYWWKIAELWQWLIAATPDDIAALPDLIPGDDLRNFQLGRPQRTLLGLSINRGRAATANLYQGWAASNNDIARMKKKVTENLPKIRHWKVTNLDYRELPNVEATWFIDPPYSRMGHNYLHHNIDYKELGEWCKSRKGQVIVCEDAFADWLPFKPFVMPTKGRGRRVEEAVWVQ